MYDFRFNYPLSKTQHSLLIDALDKISDGEIDLRTSIVGGSDEDRSMALKWLSRSGAGIKAEDIFLGAGGHNAMTAIFMTANLSGQIVVTDAITYNGLKALAGMMNVTLVSCAFDGDGMLPDALADICSKMPAKAVYLMPTIHNPLCIVMSEKRRRGIVEVARKFDLILIDDDAYGFLETQPPLNFAQLAPERSFYIYSFAKPISAGLKTSYIVTPPPFQSRIVEAIRMTSSGGSPLMARLVNNLISAGIADQIIQEKRIEGALRQQIVSEVLKGFSYQTHPNSFHIWIPLSDKTNVTEVDQQLKNNGVEVVTSLSYRVDSTPEANGFRVALGNVDQHAQVRSGLEVVANVLKNLS